MSQPTNDIKAFPSAPSTPPLFSSIPSPDFKNFKSWVRTSPFTSDFDLSKDKLQLSEMDFEAAYAMFTSKTPPTAHATNPALASHSSISNYQSELTNQLHELHNQREFGQKLTSPGLSHLLQSAVSPGFPPTELENLPIFPDYNELLSANESNAIEQFLDSIMDGENVSKDSKQIHPQILRPDPMSQVGEKGEDLGINHDVERVVPKSTQAPGTPTETISVTLNNAMNIDLPKDPSSFPKELNISSEIPSMPTRSSSTASSSSDTRQVKKRKLLTEDEKKFNHTSSEQRRRSVIKDAFDDLVKLLPLVNKSKKQPKSVVLEAAANEIERVIKINNELKQLLDNS